MYSSRYFQPKLTFLQVFSPFLILFVRSTANCYQEKQLFQWGPTDLCCWERNVSFWHISQVCCSISLTVAEYAMTTQLMQSQDIDFSPPHPHTPRVSLTPHSAQRTKCNHLVLWLMVARVRSKTPKPSKTQTLLWKSCGLSILCTAQAKHDNSPPPPFVGWDL